MLVESERRSKKEYEKEIKRLKEMLKQQSTPKSHIQNLDKSITSDKQDDQLMPLDVI